MDEAAGDNPERHPRPQLVDRRKVLTGAAVVGAAVWTAPFIVSSPASASCPATAKCAPTAANVAALAATATFLKTACVNVLGADLPTSIRVTLSSANIGCPCGAAQHPLLCINSGGRTWTGGFLNTTTVVASAGTTTATSATFDLTNQAGGGITSGNTYVDNSAVGSRVKVALGCLDRSGDRTWTVAELTISFSVTTPGIGIAACTPSGSAGSITVAPSVTSTNVCQTTCPI